MTNEEKEQMIQRGMGCIEVVETILNKVKDEKKLSESEESILINSTNLIVDYLKLGNM